MGTKSLESLEQALLQESFPLPSGSFLEEVRAILRPYVASQSLGANFSLNDISTVGFYLIKYWEGRGLSGLKNES